MKIMYDVVPFLRRGIFFRRLCLLTSHGCGDHPEKYCCHGDLQQAAHSSPSGSTSDASLHRNPLATHFTHPRGSERPVFPGNVRAAKNPPLRSRDRPDPTVRPHCDFCYTALVPAVVAELADAPA